MHLSRGGSKLVAIQNPQKPFLLAGKMNRNIQIELCFLGFTSTSELLEPPIPSQPPSQTGPKEPPSPSPSCTGSLHTLGGTHLIKPSQLTLAESSLEKSYESH